jgi:rod shape-determining protein MreC
MGARRGGGLKLSSGAIAAVGLAAVGAGVIAFVARPGQTPTDTVSVGDDALAAGVRAGSGPFAALEGLAQHIERSWNAADRVKQLEAENQQLREWRQTAQALAERLERYEALLKMAPDVLGAANLEGAVAARLVLDAGGPFKRTLLANAGADHGVRRGFVAINENGLVGRVVSIGARSSRVLLLDDYNSRVPVMGLQSRARAMMTGDASDAPSLDKGQVQVAEPRLDYPVGAGGLREGERIVTSGDGGLFPRGLLVGLAELGADGRWRVKLAAASRPIDFVRLLPFADPQTPEDAQADDPGPPLPPPVTLRNQVSTPQALAAPLAPTALPPPRPAPRTAPAPSDPVLGPTEDVDAPPPVDDPAPPQ